MLDSNRKGFAVMNKELDGYSFEHESLEKCKEYCYNTDVITEQIPYVYGFSIRVVWRDYYKPIEFKYGNNNIFWLHWNINKEHTHKTGKVVYRANKA